MAKDKTGSPQRSGPVAATPLPMKILLYFHDNLRATHPPGYGLNCASAYSRRINIQHRLVYQVISEVRVVKVIRMWAHYE